MGWVIIFVILIVIFVVLSISKDYRKDVKDNVTKHGGMQNKYIKLIEYLSDGDFTKIKKISKDNVTIESDSKTTSIDYVGGYTEIRMTIKHQIYGFINKKWKFEDGYPQKRIINEMDFYLSKINEADFSKEEDSETSMYEQNNNNQDESEISDSFKSIFKNQVVSMDTEIGSGNIEEKSISNNLHDKLSINEMKNTINNGFGSPGETARAITRLFLESKQRYNYSNKELIKRILESRAQTYRNYGKDILPDQLIDKIVFLSQGNLPLAIFADIYATNNTDNRNLTETIVQNLDLIIEVILENYNDLTPEYLRYHDHQGLKNNIEILVNNWLYKKIDKMHTLQNELDTFKKELIEISLSHKKSVNNDDITSVLLFQKQLAETYQHKKNSLISNKDHYNMSAEEITLKIDSVFEEFWNSIFE